MIYRVVKIMHRGELSKKFTVEERSDGTFIATYWNADAEYQVDRQVKEFETYSAALAHMYKQAFDASMCMVETLDKTIYSVEGDQ